MRRIAIDLGANFDSPIGKTITISDIVSSIVTGAITIAGVIVLFLIAFAGFSFIISAGQNNPEAAARGRAAATAAVTGFVIIFTSYWIIRLIELITGSDFITSPTGLF